MTATEVRVLGPITATVNGAGARLGGPRPRAVLAALVLARGELVTEEQIIDAVWEEDLPDRPHRALHTYVAGLRRALEPGRGARQESSVLHRHPGGYRLVLDQDVVDAHRFAESVRAAAWAGAEGRPQEAVAAADRALRLWRGTAYADLGGLRFVQAERARLAELRSTAREIRVAALLDLGAHHLTLADSAELTAEAPLRESGWALRAQALYRCGRQAEAVAVLGSARRVLREELGVSPGPELARITERVLAHDPTLSWPAAAG
ncbi:MULTISPECIES: AfsR/SARP family transcriptional regulator [Kitasatospora]|uniref:DNA-binding SARP family transcriptional activator n=2 Tax=Kitasatospora TaxID=2063 RepID=A0ABT1JB23_9ACTN|nr:AfsR/SARP family transcriptional regulator [Kitasatospora paracochleata]MCP2314324.1 DNA-binding SARP family transcriptional activator [Kitasatospora paracochleata]